MTDAIEYRVPILRSRFPSPRRHPAHAEIYAHCKAFCDDVLHPLARTKYDIVRGTYPDTGGGYASMAYPAGGVDHAKPMACFFGLWTFIDDLVDACTDVGLVDEILGAFTAAICQRPVDDPEFGLVAAFLGRTDWPPGVHRLCGSALQQYVDATRILRTTQIRREPLGRERYMDLRVPNVASPVMAALTGYVMPELADELCAAARTGPYRAIVRHSGICWGIALDLALIHVERATIDDWVTVDRVIQRDTTMDDGRQQAIEASVSWFHRLEQHLEADLADLATGHPAVADALRDLHAGTMTWIEMARHRGLRYRGAS
jgi:hypothetical protein